VKVNVNACGSRRKQRDHASSKMEGSRRWQPTVDLGGCNIVVGEQEERQNAKRSARKKKGELQLAGNAAADWSTRRGGVASFSILKKISSSRKRGRGLFISCVDGGVGDRRKVRGCCCGGCGARVTDPHEPPTSPQEVSSQRGINDFPDRGK